MNAVISGAIMMAYFVAGLFFLRFWFRTRDTLFAYFAVAFWILGAQRIAISVAGDRFEDDTIFYLIRLSAFVLLLVAIWNKNRENKPQS